MKELTVEQKAKRYDEALEIINNYYQKIKYSSLSNASTDREVLEKAFPQLKESDGENERIVKELLTFFRESIHGGHILTNKEYDSWIAWLEKQVEQKPQGKSALEAAKEEKVDDQNCVKLADRPEPKFKVGDKIRRKTPSSFDTDMEVARIDKDYYICNHIGKFSSEVVPFSKESSYELVEQNPAWSEEDETKIKSIIALLKSPAICAMDGNKGIIDESIKYLKSIKDRVQPQNTWKPSDEQINALSCINVTGCISYVGQGQELINLYNDLKKLKGE